MLSTLDAVPYIAIAIALLWLAVLSRRLGQVTRALPFYRGLVAAAVLVAGGAVVRVVDGYLPLLNRVHVGWVLLYSGLPALGVTIALVFAWRYWSWLLAERD